MRLKEFVIGVVSYEVNGDARKEGVEELNEVFGGGAAVLELSGEDDIEGIGAEVWVRVGMEYIIGHGNETFLQFEEEHASKVIMCRDKVRKGDRGDWGSILAWAARGLF